MDVFFLLTGFLLVGSLTRQLERTDRVDPWGLWGRLLRRLLPAATVVLVATVAVAVVLLPLTRWVESVPQWFAAALFYENWQLAFGAVDYASAHDRASPVQHFWSLAVQGQFHLVLPALAGVALALHRWTARRVGLRPLMAGALAVVLVASLAYSIATTATRQPFAYFDTAARLWEFALGGLLALGIDRLRLPVGVRVVLGWAGLVALVLCGAVVDVSALFPGWIAAWPLLAASLVLVAGTTGAPASLDRLLTSPPAVRLGTLSYALYLWHWPVLVFHLVLTGREVPSVQGGLYVLVLSLLLAEATHRWVEHPAAIRARAAARRPSSGPRSFRVVGLWLAPALVTAVAFAGLTAHRTASPLVRADDPELPGAVALAPGVDTSGLPEREPAPGLGAVSDDFFTWGDCRYSETVRVDRCVRPAGPADPTHRVLVAGDSHSMQLGAVFDELADQQGIDVEMAVKGSCPLTTDPVHLAHDPRYHEICREWNARLLQEIVDSPPDLVVTVGSRAAPDAADETVPPGYVAAWAALNEHGIPVLAVRDNPRSSASLVECVDRLGVAACSRGVESAYPEVSPLEAVTADLPLVHQLDTRPMLCGDSSCPPVVGNVLVYMDDNHLSATYARTMAPLVDEVLRERIDWWQ